MASTSRRLRLAAIALLAAAWSAYSALNPAFAQDADARRLGTFGSWHAFFYEADGRIVCYVASKPLETRPANVNRGEIRFWVTHRPRDDAYGEATVKIGYPFKKGSVASAIIDGATTVRLFTEGDGAWAENAAQDRRLVAAMKAGLAMKIDGTSSRGTRTSDRYSLNGFTAAMKGIDAKCGAKSR